MCRVVSAAEVPHDGHSLVAEVPHDGRVSVQGEPRGGRVLAEGVPYGDRVSGKVRYGTYGEEADCGGGANGVGEACYGTSDNRVRKSGACPIQSS